MKKQNPTLSKKQKLFLSLFSKSKNLSANFYLSGGTALTAFNIPYRYSEDLDFLSEKEPDLGAILAFLKQAKKTLQYQKFDLNKSFNRNIFQLIFKDKEVLKLEFTYFPFPQIERPKIENGIKIDSLMDIATNKLFTIYQNPRARDFSDLYMICKTYKYTIGGLSKKAKAKFDWHIDPLKLGSQFLLVRELKDYPRFIVKIEPRKWQEFFLEEAKKLRKEIFE